MKQSVYIVSNSSVNSVNESTHDENGCLSVAIDGGSESPSPVSPSVDELQILPVVENACVNEIAEQQQQDSEFIPIIEYLKDC